MKAIAVHLLPFALALLMGGQAAAKMVTTSLQVPFTLTVFVSNVPQPENVVLSGNIHILSKITQPGDPCQPSDPCRGVAIALHTNLDDVKGVGQITGMMYHGEGVFEMMSTLTIPGNFAFLANFRVLPGDPCSPGDPCRSLPIHLTFDSDGVMTNAVVGGNFFLDSAVVLENAPIALVADNRRRQWALIKPC